MAWLDDNGDDGEFSRIDEEPSDSEDLSDEEDAQEEEVVVTERPGLAMPPPSSHAKAKKTEGQVKTRAKTKAKSKARPAAGAKKKPAKKAPAKKAGGKRPVRRKKR